LSQNDHIWALFLSCFRGYLTTMPHRSISPRALDEAAFPVRLKLRVPSNGFGQTLLDILRWLRREIGEANFAHHEAETLEDEALAIHFRRIEDALALLSTFPRLELADDTASRSYQRQRVSRSGVLTVGRRRSNAADLSAEASAKKKKRWSSAT
jgi:hypothetical protein